jgi:hypothetical protein
MWEPAYARVLERITRTVESGVAMCEIVRAPDGTVGRVVADPTHEGAVVTFQSVGLAIGTLLGTDLLLGKANDVWQALADRPWRGLTATEAFPEPVWEPVRDVMRWVLSTGRSSSVGMPVGSMAVVLTGVRRLTTVYHPERPLARSAHPLPSRDPLALMGLG